MRSKARLLILLSPLFLTGMRIPSLCRKSVAQPGSSASGGIRG